MSEQNQLQRTAPCVNWPERVYCDHCQCSTRACFDHPDCAYCGQPLTHPEPHPDGRQLSVRVPIRLNDGYTTTEDVILYDRSFLA